MQGHWANQMAYYRCRFPAEYALANQIDHPLNVTRPRERGPPAPGRLDCRGVQAAPAAATIEAMASASSDPNAEDALDAARGTIADADAKMAPVPGRDRRGR